MLIREALRGVLKELKRDAVVMEAGSCGQAMQLIEKDADFGLILLDLNLPDRDGFSVLAELRERHPTISIVVMSGMQDRASVMKALDLGALGFIPKSAQREVMLSGAAARLRRRHLHSARDPRARGGGAGRRPKRAAGRARTRRRQISA